MKKITYLCFLIGACNWANAQVLNQNAGWPNPLWTLSGDYLATGLQSDPTSAANFAFDDDITGSGHEDNIAAESPVINLTPAFTAGETWLTVSAPYVYRYLANDELVFQYWNADTSTWVNWGNNFDALGNYTADTDYCTGTASTYTSAILNIASFTPTQLSGFKYRISYDDDPAGIDWNYGFCFQSPTVVSSTPPSCPAPTTVTAVAASTSANLSWTETGSATLYDIEWGTNGFAQGTGTTISGVTNPYTLGSLAPTTAYSFYVRASCGGAAGNSTWVGPTNFTTLATPPANDECSSAVALTVNADLLCGSSTPGTIAGATPSNTDVTACGGTEDDDVWFSFVATNTSHRISLTNLAGSTTDMYHSVWTGDCNALTLVPGSCSDPNTSNPSGLTPGQTYYVRVYTWTATANQTSTFNICIGTPPAPPANDECAGAVALTVNPDYSCGSVTAGTIQSATASTVDATACGGTEDDDVWFSFVATGETHKISLLNIAGSTTDMYHSVWTGDCGALVLVPGSCSDADTSNPAGLTPGQTYYVRVYTWTGTSGQNSTFNICIGSTPAPPANDECDGAIALTVNPDNTCGSVTAGTVAGATASATDATACAGNEDDDVWFSFVATDVTQNIKLLNVAGSTTDLYHSVWTGDCGALVQVPGSCSDANTSTPTGLTVGDTYYIRVNTFTATGGQDTTFNVCVGTNPPPPANDECTGAIAVTVNSDLNCGSVTPGTVAGATASATDATACFGTEDDDVWFSFVATSTTHAISLTNVAGSTTDMYHSLWTGDCGALVLVPGSCSDANASEPTGLTVGDTYYIRVNTYTATGGQDSTFNVCVGTNPPPPANDECAGAIALTPGGVFGDNDIDSTNGGATLSADTPAPSCGNFGFATAGKDVWYSVVVPASGNLTIETGANTAGNGMDTVVSVYSGACGSLTAVGCDDDGATETAFGLSKVAVTGQTPGATLLLRVFGYNGSQGAYSISAYDASLANSSFDNANFAYYPNPVKDVLNLTYNQEISNVEVFNLLGQKVLSNIINANTAQVDMSSLSKGAYIVNVTSNNLVKTIKVIKQ